MAEQYVFVTLDQLLDKLVPIVKSGPSVFLLYGGLGAGKTYLVKQLLRTMGAVDYVTSPSFVLVNLYEMPNNGMIAHIDLYRFLGSGIDVLQIIEETGIPDYLGIMPLFIEWPQPIEEYIGQYYGIIPTYSITVNVDNVGNRRYDFKKQF